MPEPSEDHVAAPMRSQERRRRALALVAVSALVLVGCGTSYGWVEDYNGLHATCGEERIGLYNSLPEAYAATWKERARDAACNRQDSDRYEAGPGHLGISVAVRANGVICDQSGMHYNAYADDVIGDDRLCSNPAGSQNFHATVVHRWWSQVNGTYAGVTRNTPTITA